MDEIAKGRFATLGGDKTTVPCPHCGHRLQLLDARFLQAGPVRCGACGEPVQATPGLAALAEVLGAAPRPRDRS